MSLLNQAREFRSSVDKDLDNARVLFWLRSAEQTISAKNYEVATRRLVSAALLFLNQDNSESLSVKLGDLLIAVALKSESIKAVAEGASIARRLSPDIDCFGLANLESNFSHRFLIAQIIVSEFPENKFARTQLAEFADQAGHARESTAVLFMQAEEMEGLGGDASWLKLRTGVALVQAGRFLEGRKYLRDVDRENLSGSELLWLAGGLCKTTKWLDRLRAFDILIDIHRRLTLEKFSDRELSFSDWSNAYFDFLNALPLELNLQEKERYEEEMHIFDDDAKNAMLENLNFRNQLEDESGDLESLADLILPSPLNEIALALRFKDEEMLKNNCKTLADMCRAESEEMKTIPLAVLWPFLLEAEHELDEAVVTDIARYFSRNKIAPSYGWAALSAKLFKSKFPDAGMLVARSMLRNNEGSDLRSKLIESSLKRSLEGDDEKDLLFWLDAFELESHSLDSL